MSQAAEKKENESTDNPPKELVVVKPQQPVALIESPIVTQKGPEGINFDFNYGCRIELPELVGNDYWGVRISDIKTGNVIYFNPHIKKGTLRTNKKYFIPYKIEIWKNDKLILTHEMCLKNKDVLIRMPVNTLGDVVAWFPYVAAFQEKHQCHVTCAVSDLVAPLFKETYPHIKFVPFDKPDLNTYYATYHVCLFFDDWENTHQQVDFRYVGLAKNAAYILGVNPKEEAPKIAIPKKPRQIMERYVCIATQATTQCKYWNNPGGWIDVVKWLKEKGYRVICIDKDAVYGTGISWNYIPHGAEDFTGPLPLLERAHLIAHADFFVGLSSGLSWLAWAVGVPVVVISGFSHPNNEFYTPYRVFNHHTCNSCWNDPKHVFDSYDFLWCPRHKGTERALECTKLITSQQVKSAIEKIPNFLSGGN